MKEDKHIWDDFKQEDDFALSYIYYKNIDFLFSYGKKFSKDDSFILDVVQDLFYDLIRYRKKIGDTDNIRLYLLKSFRRKLIKELEKNKRHSVLDDRLINDSWFEFSVEEEFIMREHSNQEQDKVRYAMQQLNSKQREILYYKFSCDFDYEQICDIMSISYDTARQLVSRSISLLKKHINT